MDELSEMCFKMRVPVPKRPPGWFMSDRNGPGPFDPTDDMRLEPYFMKAYHAAWSAGRGHLRDLMWEMFIDGRVNGRQG